MNQKLVAVGFNPQKIDTASTDFRIFMAKICILLFFLVSASKLAQLLIKDYTAETNQIQREFLFNNGILSHRGVLSLRAAEKPCFSLKPSAPKNKLFQTISIFSWYNRTNVRDKE